MAQVDIWHFLAGLGLFLFGLKQLEIGLAEAGGRSFKQLLRARTRRLPEAILTGTIATAILQSSSIVMLMVLAFVGAGIIELRNALGIILGSNLGTTFTGWIVATFGFKVDLEGAAFAVAGLGALLFVFAPKYSKLKSGGLAIVGFGLLLVGLDGMKSSMDQLATTLDWRVFADYPLIVFAVVAMLFTAVIQSSSATMVITLTSVDAGIISLPAAAAVVIGADLGTTMTSVLGALNGSSVKKQVAGAHVLFNLVTDVVAFVLLVPLLGILQALLGADDPLYTLVAFHSTFNLMGIVLFLPFLSPFTRMLQDWFSDPDVLDATHIHKVPPSVPEAAIEALHRDARDLVQRAIRTNMLAFGVLRHDPSARGYMDAYWSLKRTEGEALAYAAAVQKEALDADEARHLAQALRSMRESIQAAKSIKDIRSDLETAATSAEQSVVDEYTEFQTSFFAYLDAVSDAMETTEQAEQFAEFARLLVRAQTEYESAAAGIYGMASADPDNELRLSTLLNVNREIFSAKSSLAKAAVDATLDPAQADAMTNIPRS